MTTNYLRLSIQNIVQMADNCIKIFLCQRDCQMLWFTLNWFHI